MKRSGSPFISSLLRFDFAFLAVEPHVVSLVYDNIREPENVFIEIDDLTRIVCSICINQSEIYQGSAFRHAQDHALFLQISCVCHLQDVESRNGYVDQLTLPNKSRPGANRTKDGKYNSRNQDDNKHWFVADNAYR